MKSFWRQLTTRQKKGMRFSITLIILAIILFLIAASPVSLILIVSWACIVIVSLIFALLASSFIASVLDEWGCDE